LRLNRKIGVRQLSVLTVERGRCRRRCGSSSAANRWRGRWIPGCHALLAYWRRIRRDIMKEKHADYGQRLSLRCRDNWG
jgi:hypothetical protein